MITNNNAEPIKPDSNRDPVNPVEPKSPVDAIQADRFKDMMAKNNSAPEAETKENASDASDGEIRPEELQRQIREGMFKSGFQKAVERAREITKEMKG